MHENLCTSVYTIVSTANSVNRAGIHMF